MRVASIRPTVKREYPHVITSNKGPMHTTTSTSARPFSVDVSEEEIVALRHRIGETR